MVMIVKCVDVLLHHQQEQHSKRVEKEPAFAKASADEAES